MGSFSSPRSRLINVAVAAFARAGDGERDARRCWAIGSGSVVLLALTHVGTATIGIPIALAVAGISVFRVRRLRWIALLRTSAPLLAALVVVGIYALVVLAPASKDYVSNPASFAYRGPGRLMSSLFAYGPTAAIVLMGAVAAVAGVVVDGLKRSLRGGSVILTWSAGAWGSLLVAAIAGTGTDYPRLAPVLLAPLVVAAAAAILFLTEVMARNVQVHIPSTRLELVSVVAAGRSRSSRSRSPRCDTRPR